MRIEESLWNSALLPSAEEMEFLPGEEDVMAEVLGRYALPSYHSEE